MYILFKNLIYDTTKEDNSFEKKFNIFPLNKYNLLLL